MANTSVLPIAPQGAESIFEPLPVPGIKALLRNGLQRGILTEINGPRSSGRTALCLHLLAQATQRGEICAVVDLHDSFNPASALAAGVSIDRIVWVRCRANAEHAMRAADLLLHAGGFGFVLLDLCNANAKALNRIPLSYWYRFRRSVENTETIFLVCADLHQARSASVALELRPKRFRWSGQPPFRVVTALEGAAVSKTAAIAPEALLIRSFA
jgi:hypothetical protein